MNDSIWPAHPGTAAARALGGLAVRLLCWMVACGVATGVAAPPASQAANADPEAVQFVQSLLAQRPAKELSVDGVFQIRRGDAPRRYVPVKYSVQFKDQDWWSIYQTQRTDQFGYEQLSIRHQAGQPNEYHLIQVSLDGTKTNATTLSGSAAAVSFAGTDFWLSDLGLEFLHWPEQHLVRNPRINMRYGRPIKVIESINPKPSEGHYARVVSEMDSELGSLIRAQAYDRHGRKFKAFELKKFAKVNGRWQVKDMELRNDQDDSRTTLQFTFETE
jgi:hypothetical protein